MPLGPGALWRCARTGGTVAMREDRGHGGDARGPGARWWRCERTGGMVVAMRKDRGHGGGDARGPGAWWR